MQFEFINRLPRRWRIRLLGLLAAIVLYTVIGFLLLPPILKWQLEKQLSPLTKRQASVQQVKVNPWTLALTVRGLALTEPNGRPFASWEEFYVNFQASSLFRWAWTFDEIRLVKPFSELILFQDGQFNFSNLLGTSTNPPPSSTTNQTAAIPRVNIRHMEITNGIVMLEDHTRRTVFRTAYRPINLLLHDFSTRPGTDTPYSFRAESDADHRVIWSGDLSVQPLRSSGRLEVNGVPLPRFAPYLEALTRAVLTNGQAHVQCNYQFRADTNGLDLIITNAMLHVSRVQVLDPDTKETITDLNGLNIERAGFNLRENAARIGMVKISEASLLTRLQTNGHLNLLDLVILPPSSPKPAVPDSSHPLQVTIDEFFVEKSSVRFEDLTRQTPFKTELKPIEVSLKSVTTQSGIDAHYSVRITSEAAEMVEGNGTFSLQPLRSSGEIRLGTIDVKKYLPYVESYFRGKIVEGKVETRIPYYVELDSGSLDATVTNLSISLTDLEMQLPESSETITHIKEMRFEGVDASLGERRSRVGKFKGEGGSAVLRRQKDGSINLLGLLALAKTNTTAPAPEPSPVPKSTEEATTNAPALALGGWTLKVDEIQLENYSLRIEDQMLPKPATFLIDQLDVNLSDASTTPNTPIAVQATCRLNEMAQLGARGSAKIFPPFADLELAVTNLDLRMAQPYIEPHVALGISGGSLSTTSKVRFQTNDTSAPMLAYSGQVNVANFVATEQAVTNEFAGWQELSVKGIEATLLPNQLKIDEIRLMNPKASLRIGTDGRPNLSTIIKKEGSATNSPTPSPVMEAKTNSLDNRFPAQLGRLILNGASLAFTDESVQPPIALGIEEVNGMIEGLSTEFEAPAEISFNGKANNQAPFSVQGRINPFPTTRLVDLTITNADFQLTPLTGYMEKYAGYPLRKGRLNTNLRYQIKGAELQAENKIQIDQLTLGPFNNSPDAPNLPIKMGIALLKDHNGQIDLDVPLKGSLNDPEFKIGPIVVKVVVNMIVKAAASPFKLLGAIVGSGEEELNFVTFTPGSTNLVEKEIDKLSKLAAALEKRPALNLEIDGAVAPHLDGPALARQKLAEQLKSAWIQELTAEGRAPEAASTLQIEPGERDRLLRNLFIEQFGTNIAAVIQTNLARLTATNQSELATAKAPAKSERNFFQRIGGLLGFGSDRASKTEKRLSKADRQALGLATPQLMEELLIERIPVTEAEYHQLMTTRARWVYDWMVEQGRISADRLFLASPKPVDAKYAGENRVTMSIN